MGKLLSIVLTIVRNKIFSVNVVFMLGGPEHELMGTVSLALNLATPYYPIFARLSVMGLHVGD